MKLPDLVNEIDVAEKLGVSRRVVRGMVARGEFDGVAIKFGRTIRFDAEKLAEWVDSHRAGASA